MSDFNRYSLTVCIQQHRSLRYHTTSLFEQHRDDNMHMDVWDFINISSDIVALVEEGEGRRSGEWEMSRESGIRKKNRVRTKT